MAVPLCVCVACIQGNPNPTGNTESISKEGGSEAVDDKQQQKEDVKEKKVKDENITSQSSAPTPGNVEHAKQRSGKDKKEKEKEGYFFSWRKYQSVWKANVMN